MAQLTKAAFLSKWLTNFATNGVRAITGVFMQNFRQDISDSFLTISDNFIDDDTMATASATTAASSESVKAYVGSQVSAGATPDTDLRHLFTSDFTGAIYYTEGFVLNNQNSANFSSIVDFGVDGTEKAFGVHSLDTGVNTAGGIRYYRGSYRFGFGATVKLRFRAAVSAVSDATDTYTTIIGYTSAYNTFATTPDGIYFKYTHSANAGKYQCVTRASGVETSTDSGLTPSTAYDILEIRINSDATSIGFYVNSVLVQTHTLNIPSNTSLYMQAFILKSAGTTSRSLYLDWCDELITRTTAR